MPLIIDDMLKMSDQKILETCEKHWVASEATYGSAFEKMKRWKKHYHLRLVETSSSKNAANESTPATFIPIGRALCDTATAAIRGALFPDFFAWLRCQVIGEQNSLTDTQADVIRRLMVTRCNQMDYIDTITRQVLQATIMPWSCCLIGWKIRPGYYRRRQSDMTNGLAEKIREVGPEFVAKILARIKRRDVNFGFEYDPFKVNRPNIEILDSLDTRPDGDTAGCKLEDGFQFMFEKRIDWAALEDGEYSDANTYGSPYNIKRLKQAVQAGMISPGGAMKSEESEKDIRDKGDVPENTPQNKIKLRFHVTQDSLIATDEDFSMVIYKQRLAGYPLTKINWGRSVNSFATESLLQMIEPMTFDINWFVNIRRENQERSLRSVTGIRKNLLSGSILDIKHDEDVVLEFDDDPNKSFARFPAPDITQAYRDDITFFLDMIEKVVGMGENFMGSYFRMGRRTATETTDVKDAILSRLGQTTIEVEREAIYKSLKQIYSLDDAYFTREFKLDHEGPSALSYPKMTREVFVRTGGQVRFIIQGSAYWQTKREHQAALSEAVQQVASNPTIAQEFDLVELMLDKMRAGGLPDADKYRIRADDKAYSIPPEDEHYMMASGREVKPGSLDNKEQHLGDHKEFLMQIQQGFISPEEFPVENVPLLLMHINATEAQMQAEQTTNPTGMMGGGGNPPGRELAQFTEGNATSNLGNVQVGGPGGPGGGAQVTPTGGPF